MDIAPGAGSRSEVAGPHGHPRWASLVAVGDDAVRVRAVEACGPEPAPPGGGVTWDAATTYGLGQLLDAARAGGARRIVVELDGVAVADGGAGALSGLGFRVVVADGSGLKIGGDDLDRVTAISPGWAADWSEVEVELVTDDDAPYLDGIDAARRCGLDVPDDARARAALATWAAVLDHDLGHAGADRRGTGAGGGAALALLAALPRAALSVAGAGHPTR